MEARRDMNPIEQLVVERPSIGMNGWITGTLTSALMLDAGTRLIHTRPGEEASIIDEANGRYEQLKIWVRKLLGTHEANRLHRNKGLIVNCGRTISLPRSERMRALATIAASSLMLAGCSAGLMNQNACSVLTPAASEKVESLSPNQLLERSRAMVSNRGTAPGIVPIAADINDGNKALAQALEQIKLAPTNDIRSTAATARSARPTRDELTSRDVPTDDAKISSKLGNTQEEVVSRLKTLAQEERLARTARPQPTSAKSSGSSLPTLVPPSSGYKNSE